MTMRFSGKHLNQKLFVWFKWKKLQQFRLIKNLFWSKIFVFFTESSESYSVYFHIIFYKFQFCINIWTWTTPLVFKNSLTITEFFNKNLKCFWTVINYFYGYLKITLCIKIALRQTPVTSLMSLSVEFPIN